MNEHGRCEEIDGVHGDGMAAERRKVIKAGERALDG